MPEEYDTFITCINSRRESYTVKKMESLLIAQEVRIERHSKEILIERPLTLLDIGNTIEEGVPILKAILIHLHIFSLITIEQTLEGTRQHIHT